MDLGLKRGSVKLVAHNPKWKIHFEREKEYLLQHFPDIFVEISHGGSTALPNISAKPIIDMFATVSSLDHAERIEGDLEKLGYEYRGEEGVSERRLYVKGDRANRTHHLHLVEVDSREWNNHLLVKNYFLKHPEEAQEYGKLKESLAKKFPEDRKSYTSGKDNFVKGIIEKAKS